MKFVAFDLETTGIKPQENSIVEIGAVLFDGAEAVKTFGTLIDPGMPIPPDASAVNGITDEMVRGKPRVVDVLGDFSDFCGTLPLVAHNAPFDFKFLLEDVKLHRAVAPKGVVLDTLPLARKVFPGLFNYKLGTLVRHFGSPAEPSIGRRRIAPIADCCSTRLSRPWKCAASLVRRPIWSG